MPPKKKGRKPKNKDVAEKPPPKKRGRKPKGGKIIKNEKLKVISNKEEKPNIILHLKCSNNKEYNKQKETDTPQSFSINNNKTSNLHYNEIINNGYQKNTNVKLKSADEKSQENLSSMKNLWLKLDNLKNNLRYNNVSDKNSACFWCTYEFDNPAIYIPMQVQDNIINVYGCFCSPQCACAYLKREPVDSSTRWERYTLLNNIYGKIYNYKKNIKPSPDPHYTLEKFYGTLTIKEYRKLLENDTLLMIVNKPMTKITPELYEDNNEMPNVLENLADNLNDSTKNTYRLKRKKTTNSKSQIVSSNFNL